MHVDELREFCLGLTGVTESFPFGGDALVFKVKNKMFALIPIDHPELQISLKCNPEDAIELRATYSSITPAYHFNKKHWNTVYLRPDIPESLVCELILHSYQLVVSGLTRRKRDELVCE